MDNEQEQKEFKITKRQVILAVGVSLVSIFFYIGVRSALNFQLEYEKNLLQRELLSEKLSRKPKDFFEDLNLSAKAFLVFDLNNKKTLVSHNEEVQLPLASLTKLMTVYVANKEKQEGSLLTIQEKDLAIEGESGLVLGEHWAIPKLIDFVLVTSSNDGASALASVVASQNSMEDKKENQSFVDKMNETAHEIGMVQSYFLNPSGLDVNEALSGAYGSAEDVAILVEKILNENGRVFKSSVSKKEIISSLSNVYEVENTNVIVDKLPGALVSKTGYTDLAGGNLAMAFNVGLDHKIIIVVLGSTREERFTDMEKLFWASADTLKDYK